MHVAAKSRALAEIAVHRNHRDSLDCALDVDQHSRASAHTRYAGAIAASQATRENWNAQGDTAAASAAYAPTRREPVANEPRKNTPATSSVPHSAANARSAGIDAP